MGRERYSEQFKRDAVRLVTEEGYSINGAAASVGIAYSTLNTWMRRFDQQVDRPEKTYASAEDELADLRAENRRLRMEREILKKAAVYFAKDQ
jgi:transposase